MPNPKTAALDFEEFSYVDGQGTFRRIDAAWLDILSEYLAEYYQAESVSERLPYLVVWCNDTMPPPSERPFMIAGLVAVWLVQGKDKYPQVVLAPEKRKAGAAGLDDGPDPFVNKNSSKE